MTLSPKLRLAEWQLALPLGLAFAALFLAPLLLFPADHRVREVGRLLSSTRPAALRPRERPELKSFPSPSARVLLRDGS